MNPATVLLASPGLALMLAGSRIGDTGLQVLGGVLTAITAAGFFWMVRAFRTAMIAKNEEITRRVVREVLQAELGPQMAELSDVVKDIDQVAGQVSAAHRRIDGVMQAERPPRG